MILTVGADIDQAGDEVAGQGDQERIGVHSYHGDGVENVGPPPNIPHVFWYWPSKVLQQLRCICPKPNILKEGKRSGKS